MAISFDDKQKQLLNALLNKKGYSKTKAAETLIPKADPSLDTPISYEQDRIWFFQQYSSEKDLYTMPVAISIQGRLHVDDLRRSIRHVVERQEMLRTKVLVNDQGEPYLDVQSVHDIPVGMVDLEAFAEPEEILADMIRDNAEYAFQTDCPLFKIDLVRLNDVRHILLINLHHLICDGWSLGVLQREIQECYRNLSTGNSTHLPPLSIQYRDYAQWQQKANQHEKYRIQADYWKRRLHQCPDCMELPYDWPRPAHQTFSGANTYFQIDKDLSRAVNTFAKDSNLTPFMVLIGMFKLLLSVYSNQNDICVGTTVNNRNLTELQSIVGLFINTLVLRTRIDDEIRLIDFLQRVKETCIEAFEHQDLPFHKVVEAVKPKRNLSFTPLFQVMFTFEEKTDRPQSLKELDWSPLESENKSSKFDITLHIEQDAGGFKGRIEYNTDLFTQPGIENLAAHYQTLIRNLLNNPTQRVKQLSLRDESAIHEKKHEHRKEIRDGKPERVHEIIEQQAALYRDKVALIAPNQTLTYSELCKRVDELSADLNRRGIKTGSRIGVCLNRSTDTLIAPLSLWKLGCIYVPIDPALPLTRIRTIIEAADIEWMLTHSDNLPKSCVEGVESICLDEWSRSDEVSLDINHVDIPAAQTEPVAYILFTSGSTGVPKGVVVSHHSFAVGLTTFADVFNIQSHDSIPCLASESFDISLFELFITLIRGGTVLLETKESGVDLVQLSAKLGNITRVNILPGLAKELVRFWRSEHRKRSLRSTVQTIFIGGDAVSVQLLEEMRACWPDADIIQTYGPTEGTMMSSYHVMPKNAPMTKRSLIGTAYPHVELMVLDKHGRRVPHGVYGELYIGGEGLALGYLDNPTLTAEKFVSHPWHRHGGARLYRTGDRVRRCLDGNLEFKGRIDNQVKIRGFRIELGEIEAVLCRHDNIRDAVVASKSLTDHENRQLVAYLVAHDGSQWDEREIKSRLESVLPEYMVPAVFLTIDSIPLTSNGKIDRDGLPTPDFTTRIEAGYVAPQSDLQHQIVAIWEDILNLDQVGIRNDFFEIGGHSLLATQLVSRIRNQLSFDIQLRIVFENRTIESLVQYLETIDIDAKRQGITKLSHKNNLSLSFAQQRLWFIQQLEGPSRTYNIPMAVRLSGKLDDNALFKSFEQVVARHEIFRTRFVEEEGKVYQVIDDDPTPNMTIEERSESEIKKIMMENLQTVFDLEKGPLYQIKLVRITETNHVLLINIHHIISDAWSSGVLMREITDWYAAYSTGNNPVMQDLSIQYSDFAAWQRQYLTGKRLQKMESYWSEQLKNLPILLDLPTDFPRPAAQSFKGASESSYLSQSMLHQLNELSQREGMTLFMTLLAMFQILLSKYSGKSDVFVGSPIANRSEPELEPLVGFFANTLVIRSRTSPEISYRDFLKQVKENCLEAYEHQDVPFEHLVDLLSVERSLAYSPLFQVMFVLQNTSQTSLNLPDITISPMDIGVSTTKFDLTLTAVESIKGITVNLEYNTDLFEAATIKRMLGHFERVLKQVIADPDRLISTIDVLTDPERRQLLVDWNNTRADFPQDQCLHNLLEEQVEKTPDDVAVVFREQQLSFRRLNGLANQLAHFLKDHYRVQPEDKIAMLLDRSEKVIVTLLGILKSGAAYVPINPEYPDERIIDIIEDSHSKVVISDGRDISINTAPVLDIFKVLQQGGCCDNPEQVVRSDNPAYAIYTSGSTGTPKGTLIEHRSIVNTIHWRKQYYREHYKNDHAILQFASYAFDSSVEDIFTALAGGSKVVMIEDDKKSDVAYLESLVQSHAISSILLVPAMYDLLAKNKKSALNSLSHIVLAGEEFSPQLIQDHFKLFPGTKLYNEYGPTENSVCSTVFSFNTLDRVLIGKPISNVHAYVLDCYNNLLPIGVPGELCVSGIGLARGYLNRPELNREKFVPHPYANDAGSKLYKTGDLVRWLPDGNIEYLGRIDNQVKIRGFRVELGEIENQLRGYEDVGNVVVDVKESQHSQKHIVAYVVPEAGKTIDDSRLQDYLKTRLPNYMIPSAFVQIDRLPLNNNGKIDRKALPEYDFLARSEHNFVAPNTHEQKILSGIWSEVLGREEIGIHENFFRIGGHSLLATQVISRIQKEFGYKPELKTLFFKPTISELADEIRSIQTNEPLNPISKASRQSPLPLSFAQQRLWFIDQLERETAAYNIPIALRLNGLLDEALLISAIERVIQRHESLRTRFVSENGSISQVIDESCDFNVSVRSISEPQIDCEIERNNRMQFDLEKGPLYKFEILRLSEGEHILLINLHHIISDGWSMGILMDEITSIYSNKGDSGHTTLSDLPIQYADYAIWQRNHLQGENLQRQEEYWRNQLNDMPAVLELPTDHPRPARQTFNGDTIPFVINQTIQDGLKRLSHAEGTSLFMMILASFQIFLNRITNQSDIAVGSPISGRSTQELEGLIGIFVNTLVLRSQVDRHSTVRDFLGTVKKTALDAYDHQDVPFEHLVDVLSPQRSLSHSPLFQVMLLFENLPATGNRLSDIEISPLGTHYNIAKFDLSISYRELEQGASGEFNYNTDLFEKKTIQRLVDCYLTLLENIVTNPNQRIGDLNILTEYDHRQVVLDWNHTETKLPEGRCFFHMFEQQVEQNPDSIAAVYQHQQLSYRELNCKANQLAHKLLKNKIGPETLIGICMKRSLDVVVAVMAIAKAGAAYVPLDPDYPVERLNDMINRSQVEQLITQEDIDIEFDFNGEIQYLPELMLTTEALPETNPGVRVDTGNPAYVIFTSGSTGKPKGVVIEHKSVTALIDWANHTYELSELERVPATTSLCFDLSIFEMFVPLCVGGTFVIDENILEILDKPYFNGVTLINTVPSALKMLLNEKKIPKSVRVVNVAGESFSPELITETYRLNHIEKLYNLYGPSEDTTYSTMMLTENNNDPRYLIGRPISNTRIYIVDDQMNPVPIGVFGELVIGGCGLSRGYINQPDITGAAFIPDAFSGIKGARLYKTGDLARFRSDGSIEYSGRLDNQVKINGFRIELGEIETLLNLHNDVHHGVVSTHSGESSSKHLVAYVVPTEDGNFNELDLKLCLKSKLPDYMIPNAFIRLDQLPMTPNRKIDRKALPALQATKQRQTHNVPAVTETEISLSQIWMDVLSLEKVGILDDFFELGGHSLLIPKLISGVRELFSVKLEPATIFYYSTIEALSRYIDESNSDGDTAKQLGANKLMVLSANETISCDTGKQNLFCIPGIGGNVLEFIDFADLLTPDYNVFTFSIPGLEEDSVPCGTIEALADDYIHRMKRHQPVGPYHLIGYSFGGRVALEIFHQLKEQDEHTVDVVLIDCHAPSNELDEKEALIAGIDRLLSGHHIRNGNEEAIKQFGNVQKEQFIRYCLGDDPNRSGFEQFQHWYRLAQVIRNNLKIGYLAPKRNTIGQAILFKANHNRTRDNRLEIDSKNGWGDLIPSANVIEVAGDHETILKKPNIITITESIKNRINS